MKYLSKLLVLTVFAYFGNGPAFAQMYPGQGWGWHDSSWGWGHMIFGGVMMILIWGGIIVVLVLLVRWLAGLGHSHPEQGHRAKTPLDILKERFARGEIDQAEFEERKKLLTD